MFRGWGRFEGLVYAIIIEIFDLLQKEFNDDYAQREMELREHFHKELEKKEHELRNKEEQV